jgi:hypothetical protein
MPPAEIIQATAGIIVAINRINPANAFLPFMIMCPAVPDWVIPLAAAAAVAEIKSNGGKISEGFRINAQQWLIAFDGLPDAQKLIVKQMMEVAWRDGGQTVPSHIFGKGTFLPLKTFGEISADLQSMIPKRFTKPYD